MKIAIIEKEEPLKASGVDVFNQRLKTYLTRRGHRVYALRFSKKKVNQKDTFHLPYYYVEKRTAFMIPSERSLGMIKKHLRQINPDLIYASPGLASPVDFFFPSISKQLRVPLVGTWHLDFNRELNPIQILTKSVFLAYLSYCKQVDLLHLFSQRMKEFYTTRGVDAQKIIVLPNPVDPRQYYPAKSAFARQNQISKGILFVGRLSFQKNPEVLLKSFMAINPPTGVKLVMMGTGELEEELREKYQDPRIIFTGVVLEEKKKIDMMRSCQVFVLPSRYEGLSLALLEAMSLGLACVATDVATTEEVLADCGIVIREDKARDQLPLALKLCLDYPSFTADLGRRARTKVIREYNQDKIFARLTREFERVVREYRGKQVRKEGFLTRFFGR